MNSNKLYDLSPTLPPMPPPPLISTPVNWVIHQAIATRAEWVPSFRLKQIEPPPLPPLPLPLLAPSFYHYHTEWLPHWVTPTSISLNPLPLVSFWGAVSTPLNVFIVFRLYLDPFDWMEWISLLVAETVCTFLLVSYAVSQAYDVSVQASAQSQMPPWEVRYVYERIRRLKWFFCNQTVRHIRLSSWDFLRFKWCMEI